MDRTERFPASSAYLDRTPGCEWVLLDASGNEPIERFDPGARPFAPHQPAVRRHHSRSSAVSRKATA